ncbi:hypothetical protein HK101_010428 [Irineochytrium annulatum]|nr:hypothetical protein HK101_010428 [Irineochytrium annulatum]
MLFGDAHGQFAFAPDFDLSYGYAGQAAIDAVGVKGLSFMGRLVLLLATAVNVIHIGSFATLAAITITNGVKALGEKGLAFRDLNLIPFVTLTLHAAETVVLFLGLNAGSASLAGLAGMIGYARGVTSVITLASVVGGGGLFLQSWATGIGRDGRQKIN